MQVGLIGKPLGVRKSGPAAALSIAFTSGVLDPRITFSRPDAATCATSFGSDGRLVTVAANIPRFDYDPSQANGTTGPELVADPSFDSAPYWTANAGWAVTGGTLVATSAAGNSYTARAGVVTAGKTYFISINCTSLSAGGFKVLLEGGPSAFGDKTTSGAFSGYVTATSTGGVYIWSNSTLTATFDNISVREVQFTPRGLLIEESRTNLLLHSRDMTQAAWSKTDVTANRNQIGLDGVANSACLMTEGSAGTAVTAQVSAAITAGSTVTFSKVFKRGNTDWIRIGIDDGVGTNSLRGWFNLNTGAKGGTQTSGTASAVTSSMTSLGGGWYRCTLSGIVDGATTTPRALFLSAAADFSTTRVANATYIVDCAGLEVGAFATSIIITDASTKTRAADSASMTGTNFSSWFNASAGTFVAEYDSQGLATTSTYANGTFVLQVGNASANRISLLASSTQTRPEIVSSSTVLYAPTWKNNGAGTNRQAIAYANSVTTDGALAGVAYSGGTNTAGTMPTVSMMYIGCCEAAGNQLNGHIRRLAFYPPKLPNATLQALTA